MTCVDCKRETPELQCATTSDGETVCFECCAFRDMADMMHSGTSKRLPLYLTEVKDGRSYLSNWPGTLRFPVRSLSKGRHNIAGSRTDVWFRGPDGCNWHGVLYGELTQICHCKRTKC